VNMLIDWSDTHTAAFQKSAMTFKHGLNATGLFTDEALIKLLDKHPSQELDVCAMPFPGEIHFRTGDVREADGKTLLAIAKTGAIWINLRRAMNTKVPYHFDKTETILWHVRGKKRLYLYPESEEFLSDEAYEDSLVNVLSDDVPYNESFEKGVQVFDLEPDQAITWPLNSPHRVVNSSYCVSVTTEYSTAESVRKNANIYLNATLRRKLGMDPSYRRDGEIKRTVKSVFGRVLKKTGMGAYEPFKDNVTFKILAGDLNIHDVDPYPRDF